MSMCHHQGGVRLVALVIAAVVWGGVADAADPHEQFDTLFGPEAKAAAASKDPKTAGALAQKLADAAKAVPKDVPLQILLYEKACEFGLKDPASAPVAIDAASQLLKLDPQHKAERQQKVLDAYEMQYRQSKPDERPRTGRLLLDRLLPTAEERAAARQLDEAEKLLKQAALVATASNPRLGDDILARLRTIQKRREAQKTLDGLEMRAMAEPPDRAAARQLAELDLIEMDDLAAAQKFAGIAGDDRLKAMLALAAKDPDALTETECLDLGDWVRKLGETASPVGKVAAYGRAKTCYERYLILHKDKDGARLKAELALKQVTAALPRSTASAANKPTEFTYDGLKTLDRLQVVPLWEKARPKKILKATTIADSQTFTAENSPYLVNGYLLVDAQGSLTIEAGVTLLFAPDAKLHNKGTLKAVSDEGWIVFAGAERGKQWEGVISEGTIELRRCIVSGAKEGVKSTHGREGLTARECLLAGNGRGVNLTGRGVSGTVENCLFLKNDMGLASYGEGFSTFSRCLFVGNKKGFYGQYYGGAKGTQSTFYGNVLGLESSEYQCPITISDCNIVGNTQKQAHGGSDPINLRKNYWGKDVAKQIADGKSVAITGKVEAYDWLEDPVTTAFPMLPRCEYLSR